MAELYELTATEAAVLMDNGEILTTGVLLGGYVFAQPVCAQGVLGCLERGVQPLRYVVLLRVVRRKKRRKYGKNNDE